MALTKVTGDFIKDGVLTQAHLHTSHGITTAHIGEGSNLYFTNARVASYLSSNNYVSGTGTNNRLAIWNGTGVIDSDSDFYVDGDTIFTTNFQASGNISITGTSFLDGDVTIGDTNSAFIGMARAGANYLAATNASGYLVFRTAGSNERMRVGNSGNVGIGTTMDINKLDVAGNINVQGGDGSYLTFNNGDANIVINNNGSGRDLSFKTYDGSSNSERMRIDKDGNLGIGLTNPTAKLQVVSGDEQLTNFSGNVTDRLAYSRINSFASTSGTTTGAAALELVGNANGSGHGRHAWIGAEGTSSTNFLTKLKFKIRGETNNGYAWAGSSEAPTIMTLEGNGNVGIGTTSPLQKVHLLNGGFAYMRFTSQSYGATGFDIGQHTNGNIYLNNRDNTSMVFMTNNATALTINNSQNATFAADITVSGGDITLGGTGRIQGIDTVSANTDAANKLYVDNQVAGIVDSAPGTLNTLNELAAALGDDANFSATVTNSIGLKAPLASPSFTGNATFAGGISVSSPGSSFYTTFKSANDYVIGLKDSANTTQWWLKAFTNGSFALHEDSVGDKFTIAAGGNATFAGDVQIDKSLSIGKAGGASGIGNLTLFSRYSVAAPYISFKTDHPSQSTVWETGRIDSTDSGNFNGKMLFKVATGSGSASGGASMGTVLTLDDDSSATFAGTIAASGGNSTQWNTAYGWGNHASAGYFTNSGSWLGDLGSYSYTREHGIQMTGGSEFVILSKSGQGSVLIDGHYMSYEAANGFFGSYNSAYGNLTGIRASAANTLKVMQLDGGNAILEVTQDARAPIFYDLGNTAYYTDPASRSILNDVNADEFKITSSTNNARWNSAGDWGTRLYTDAGYLQFGPANTSHAHIYTDRPNIYTNKPVVIDGGTTLNSGDIRTPIFYDSNNTGRYIDPASTSRIDKLEIANTANQDTPGGRMKIGSDGFIFGGNNDGYEINSAQISAGYHTSNSLNFVGMGTSSSNRRMDFWAEGGFYVSGIIYDKDSTSYYLDLGNTSRTNSIISNVFSGDISTSGDGQNNYPFRLRYDYNAWMMTVASNTWGLFWAGNSGARYGTNGNGGPGNIWSNSGNPNEFAFVGSDSTAWTVHGSTGNVWLKGYGQAAGSYRAPIFYDSNNTNYYIDPASNSVVNSINGFQTTTTGGASKLLATAANGYLYLNNWIYVDGAGLFSSVNGAHIYPNQSSDYGAWRMNGTRNGWNGITFDVNGTNNTLMANEQTMGFYNDGDNEWMIEAQRNSHVRFYYNGVEEARTDVGFFLLNNQARSPIYYDSADTAYYANLNSLSHIRKIAGVRTNLATSEGWGEVNAWNTGTQTGYFGGSFTINGSSNENNISWEDGPSGTRPTNKKELVWKVTTNSSDSGADGGWNKTITGIDYNKSHISILYVKRVAEGNGNFYHGTATCLNLNGTSNGNPYFQAIGSQSLPLNVWCVSIGFLRANNDTASTAATSWSGIYRLDTGERILGATDFRLAQSTNSQHRCFLYYSTNTATELWFANPGFYEINGNEPKLSEILMRPEDRTDSLRADVDMRAPIFYDSNNTSYFLNPSASGGNALNTIGDWRQTTDTWSGEVSGKMQYHSNHWYLQAAGYVHFRNTSGVNTFYVDSGGVGYVNNYLTGANSLRAPLFYDSNDTNYYIDPSSTSNLNAATFAGNVVGQNAYFNQDVGIGFTSGNIGGRLNIRNSAAGQIAAKLELGSSSNGSTIGTFIHTGASYASAGMFLNFQSNHISGDDNVLICYLDGDLVNKNNSYTQYSDERLKENIVDATPKLNEIKQIKVRNFNFKGEDLKQIGVVAQEFESIFPALVKEREVPGHEDPIKTVKYSVLVPILIKAMQEQQTIIDDLKSRLETLENQ